ncbi:hypothetical protein [Flavobacterium subsaxonicum]|uniref:Lipoprotein n=1 Tax=Flavobacterium subsaxonicum WB 4.1-42 = DSM 21790 TaxID=1121898 RepID=A0A0A2MNF3_9FLAO|nr:hypothetical protein [Flavobacterium subsaxonicum]KGO94157.1 hypothetical protein Q766_04290 [Flavobacterium subsaxonicum WB 4.1-42 = DSM 21790]
MKKTILKSLAGLFTILLMVSCSTEETSVMPDENAAVTTSAAPSSNQLTARGSFWSGKIAEIDANGNAQFVINPQLIIDDFEAQLRDKGAFTDLTSVVIEKQAADNDPSDVGYIVIATDGNGFSMGTILERTGYSLSDGDGTTVGCRGCVDGCNLRYLLVDGHKFPYCREGNCGADCVRED